MNELKTELIDNCADGFLTIYKLDKENLTYSKLFQLDDAFLVESEFGP